MANIETQRGLRLPCPKCGEEAARIALHLSDMETFRCEECEEEFTAADMVELVKRWAPVLKWIETAPK